jgi:hypothetical protein
MSTINLQQNAVSQLAAQADAVGKLAQDTGAFAAVVAAFESNDPDALSWVLQRLELLPQCELICEWIRVKWCGLRCVEVCGPPDPKVPLPSLPQFARALTQLASNEAQLRRAVDAVSCGDADSYHAAIVEAKLQDYCHLLCRYICSTLYRRICEVVCTRQTVGVADAALDIRADAEVLRRVIANESLTGAIVKAAEAFDCEVLRAAINEAAFAGNCEIICRLICVWRCVWISRRFCVEPPPILRGTYAVEEARSFALAARQLAGQPRALSDLTAAVISDNAQGFSAIVDRFGLGPYCWQVCGWVCSEVCYEFCVCVCPNPALNPLFSTVGNFDIYSQIDPTSGKTTVRLPAIPGMPYGGGPNYAFYSQLQLGGNCPFTSPTFSGVPMQYRFLYSVVTTTLAANINSSQPTITVASSVGAPATLPFYVSVCQTVGPLQVAEIMEVTLVSGTTWHVNRSMEGTTSAAAGAGAAVGIMGSKPTPITDSLVSPVLVGTQWINWTSITAVPPRPLVPTLQQVYIGPSATTNPAPPISGPWFQAPTILYVTPDPDGWVKLPFTPLVNGSEATTLMGFDTTQVVSGGCALPSGDCIGPFQPPNGAPTGSAVPAASQGAGTDLSIIFQATRVGVATVDYSNSLCTIHINNWLEVNNLWFNEFTTGGAGCCTPINDTLTVQLTVDHEEMPAGDWSLSITSCSPSAPGTIASYGYASTTLAQPIPNGIQPFIIVASSAGFPSAFPFNVFLSSSGEVMTVTSFSPGNQWNVTRGASAAAAPAGAVLTSTLASTLIPPGANATPRGAYGTIVENTSTWGLCSYTAALYTRPALTTGLYDYEGHDVLLTFCICAH